MNLMADHINMNFSGFVVNKHGYSMFTNNIWINGYELMELTNPVYSFINGLAGSLLPPV